MAEDRRTFKQAIKADTQRRGRNESQVKIRKEKRRQHLKKKRYKDTSASASPPNFGNSVPNAVSHNAGYGSPMNPMNSMHSMNPMSSMNSMDNMHNMNQQYGMRQSISAADLADLKRGLTSSSAEERLMYTKRVRKLLSKEEDPPASEVIEAGLVPILIKHLSANDNSKLQFEAAWALTNIASTEYTKVIVDLGAVAPLALLMKSHSPDVREQSCWCLGNVAGDGPILRDIVLRTPACLANLILNITHSSSRSMRRNATWALSNFCRGKPQPDIELVKDALPILQWLIKLDDDEVLRDACWAFSYISDGDDDRIQAVINQGPVPHLVKLLSHGSTSVVTPALRTIGNVISGNDEQTQHAMDCQALQALVPLLDHDKKNVRKEACWTLSNIAAGTAKQAEQLVCSRAPDGTPVIEKVIHLASQGEWEVRKEAAWILANICTGGNLRNIQKLINHHALDAIVGLLDEDDVKIVMVALEALEAVLRKGHDAGGPANLPHGEHWVDKIMDIDGQTKLEMLQEHDNDEVYHKCAGILKTFFDAEEDIQDDDKVTADGMQYNFTGASGMDMNHDSFGLGGGF